VVPGWTSSTAKVVDAAANGRTMTAAVSGTGDGLTSRGAVTRYTEVNCVAFTIPEA
jgi:hypothetical protein